MTDGDILSRDDVEVIDPSGKVLFFSTQRFVENIAGKDVCFICGASPNSVTFNQEHVIPDWILTEYNLHSRRITLPNESPLRYGQFTVPCCADCNAQMGDVFEKPISQLMKRGFSEVTAHLVQGGIEQIFQWLSLIYLKTHLKDRHLRFHLDRRKDDMTLADMYDWRDLHHIHCVARAFFTGAKIAPEALGSIFVFPARNIEPDVNFDYADSYEGRTILLRLGEIAFIAVLNDSCAVWSLMQDDIRRIAGPLSSIQLRELMARMAYTNMRLRYRPQQYSAFEALYSHPDLPSTLMSRGAYAISAHLPELESLEINTEELGKLLGFYVRSAAGAHFGKEKCEQLVTQLEDGLHSLIFGTEGEFLVNPLPLDGEILRPVQINFSHY
jgi:hypothetical protein